MEAGAARSATLISDTKQPSKAASAWWNVETKLRGVDGLGARVDGLGAKVDVLHDRLGAKVDRLGAGLAALRDGVRGEVAGSTPPSRASRAS